MRRVSAVFFIVLLITGVAFGAPDTVYYSDRFVFLGSDVNAPGLVLLNFSRGRDRGRYYGEFYGAFYDQNRWRHFEGNDKYPYRAGDLTTIQPSYYARAEGSVETGFRLRYDGGDVTLNIASGPTRPLSVPNSGRTLTSTLGVSEALLVIRGKEVWGSLLHEPLRWTGFNGLKRYAGLFKEYHRFYLTTESGREMIFHQNKADRKAFLNRHHLTETFQARGGVIQADGVYPFIPLIHPSGALRPGLAFYTVPDRWQADAGSFGTLHLWSRDMAVRNWLFGGYYLMTVEGVLRNGSREERVWGLLEYIP
jgi:hypothetical protein